MTKQELIDHLQHLEQYTHYSEDAPALREVIEMLKCSEMPNSSDTISRQAAIDALDCINGTEEVLRSLPSAQPEIIRCKDCKHRDAEYGFCKGRGWPMQLVPDDGFCDKGERSEE